MYHPVGSRPAFFLFVIFFSYAPYGFSLTSAAEQEKKGKKKKKKERERERERGRERREEKKGTEPQVFPGERRAFSRIFSAIYYPETHALADEKSAGIYADRVDARTISKRMNENRSR